MIIIRSLALGLLLLLIRESSVWSFDPARTDIATLRLGMTDGEVLDRLAARGYQTFVGVVGRDQDSPDSIRARTRDGGLLIEFAATGRVNRIVYTFPGRGPNEAAILRAAMVARFGEPTLEEPLTWCAITLADGRCSTSKPILTFIQGGGFQSVGGTTNGLGVLTLATGTGE